MPYDPKCGKSIFDFSRQAQMRLEGKEVNNMEFTLTEVDAEMLAKLQAGNRKRGEAAPVIERFVKSATTGQTAIVECAKDKVKSTAAKLVYASKKQKVEDKVTVLPDEDNNRVILLAL